MTLLVCVVLFALAVYRVVRFVQLDRFPVLAPTRARIIDAADQGQHTYAAELLTCPWCLSIWVATGLLALVLISALLAAAVVIVLATSTVVGLVQDHLAGH